MPEFRKVLTGDGEHTAILCRSGRPRTLVCIPVASEREADAIADRAAELFERSGAAAVYVSASRWQDDLSPWQAEPVFRGGERFGGNAGRFLSALTEKILPEAENELGGPDAITCRIAAGYSLAGLFAAYAPFVSDIFDGIVSASGSMWFDGFCGFVSSSPFVKIPRAAYFSVGDREKKARNARMAAVEDCTAAVAAAFREKGADTVFELNAGGHFDDPEGRLVRGIGTVLERLI